LSRAHWYTCAGVSSPAIHTDSRETPRSVRGGIRGAPTPPGQQHTEKHQHQPLEGSTLMDTARQGGSGDTIESVSSTVVEQIAGSTHRADGVCAIMRRPVDTARGATFPFSTFCCVADVLHESSLGSA
jgi:hypothetical protein